MIFNKVLDFIKGIKYNYQALNKTFKEETPVSHL
jgi:hypothetical protein